MSEVLRRATLATLSVLAVALLTACPSGRVETDEPSADPPRSTAFLSAEPEVRVRLSAVESKRSARVRIAGPWRLLTLDGRELARGTGLDQALPVDRQAPWVAGNRTPRDGFVLRPGRDGDLRVGDRNYPGSLRVSRSVDARLRAYVVCSLEAYLPGVVGGEIPAKFPTASQRVQAILARTYALSRRRGGGEPLVLSDTGREDQEYHGISPVAEHRRIADEAVRATEGQVLFEDGKPLRCWYHSTCGGHTVPAEAVFPVPPSAALAGVGIDRCQESKYYTWSGSLSSAAVLKLAGLRGPLRRLEVATALPHGRATELQVLAADGDARLDAASARLSLGPSVLRSTWITSAVVRGDQVAVEGRGWGHGVGLCQMCAKGLADGGADARSIVEAFYPGAVLERVW